MLGVTVTYLLNLKQKVKVPAIQIKATEYCKTCVSRKCIYSLDANGTTYAWGEGSVHGKEISSDEPVSYDEMKALNLNVVYAQVKEKRC